jgi:hypothetical protein
MHETFNEKNDYKKEKKDVSVKEKKVKNKDNFLQVRKKERSWEG